MVQPQHESPPCGLLGNGAVPDSEGPREGSGQLLGPRNKATVPSTPRGPSFTPWEREWSTTTQHIAPSLRLSQKGHKETFRGKETLCALTEM